MSGDLLTFAGSAATILRAINNAKPFACTDPEWDPPIICGVHLRADDDALVVEATDRYVLLSQSIDVTIKQPGSAVIPSESVKKVTSLLKDAGKDATAAFTVAELATHWTLTVESGSQSLTIVLRTGTFPNTSKVLNPTEVKSTFPADALPVVGLNAQMLALLGKVKTSDPSTTWLFTFRGPLEIVTAKPGDPDERMVFGQMPVRTAEVNS